MEELEANYSLNIDKFNLLGENACAKEDQGLELHEPHSPKHENSNLKARIEEFGKLINKLCQEKFEIMQKEELEGNRHWINYELKELYRREASIVYQMNQNWKKLDIFKLFLDKLNLPNKGELTKSYLSREDVDKHKLHFWTRHCNTSSLAKEKQLFKQIKASQQTDVVDYASQYSREEELDNSSWLYHQMRCEKVHRKGANDRIREVIEERPWYLKKTIPEAIVEGDIRNSLSSNRKAIRNQMKVLCDKLEELRKRHMEIGEEIGDLKRKLKIVKREISSYKKKKCGDINQRKKKAYECLLKLKKQADQD